MTRQFVARALRAVANMVESSHAGAALEIEDAPAGTPEPRPFAATGSEAAKADQALARMYLFQALRRYSPNSTPHA